MRKFKTIPKYRKTYRYYFVNDEMTEISENEEVKQKGIAFLHQLDDEEVDAERRENYRAPIHYEDFFYDDENDELPTNPFLIDEYTPLDEIFRKDDWKNKEVLVEKLHLAIQQLTPKQQLTIQKIFYEGMTNSEFAREEKVGESAIRSRLNKIMRKLRKEILK